MIFVHGYVHCDPHPGNVLVNKTKQGNTEIVLLDHGLYQVCCSPPLREYSTVVNKIKKDETEITLLDHVLCQICLGFTLGISDIGGSH
jgi:aarF domain-containing kinase